MILIIIKNLKVFFYRRRIPPADYLIICADRRAFPVQQEQSPEENIGEEPRKKGVDHGRVNIALYGFWIHRTERKSPLPKAFMPADLLEKSRNR